MGTQRHTVGDRFEAAVQVSLGKDSVRNRGKSTFRYPERRRLARVTDPRFSASHADLTDSDMQSEIELVGDLVVAVAGSEGPLTQEQIDRVLGVDVRLQGRSFSKAGRTPAA